MASVSAWERGSAQPLARSWGALGRILGEDVVLLGTDFPTRLRNMRRRQGLTQAETAHRAGVDPRTVRNWEQGRYLPTRKKL